LCGHANEALFVNRTNKKNDEDDIGGT